MKYSFVHIAYLLGIVGILISSGCKNRSIQIVEETYQDGKNKVVKHYKGSGENRHLVYETQFYPNGNKKVEGSYKNNKKQGTWIYYFEDGAEWSIGNFKQGIREGKAKVFHENGNLFFAGTYKNGQKTGTWKFYNNQGDLVNTTTFENGVQIMQSNTGDTKPN